MGCFNKCRKIDLDEFLSVNVKSIYQLDIADDQLDKWQNLFKNESVGRVLVSDYTTKAEFIIPELNLVLGPAKYEILN